MIARVVTIGLPGWVPGVAFCSWVSEVTCGGVRPLREFALVFACFAAVAIVATWPLLPHAVDSLPAGFGDPRTCHLPSRLGCRSDRTLAIDDRRAPVDVDLPPNRTTVLRLRQTGDTRTMFWSVHELGLWERR